jgi:hypothetical protein
LRAPPPCTIHFCALLWAPLLCQDEDVAVSGAFVTHLMKGLNAVALPVRYLAIPMLCGDTSKCVASGRCLPPPPLSPRTLPPPFQAAASVGTAGLFSLGCVCARVLALFGGLCAG